MTVTFIYMLRLKYNKKKLYSNKLEINIKQIRIDNRSSSREIIEIFTLNEFILAF